MIRPTEHRSSPNERNPPFAWPGLPDSIATMSDSKPPTIAVPLTAGNLRNGHVYVRDYLWFFPKTAIRGTRYGADTDACLLDLEGVGPIETDIDPEKGIFRWRGWKKFFKQHHVGAGDEIVFSRRARNEYDVRVVHQVLGMENGTAEHGRPDRDPHEKKPRIINRCNDLSGDEWLRYSISVWSDIRKTAEEAALGHPAMFPTMLCERLMTMYLRRRGKHRILDPFMGSGSTLVAARNLQKVGIGFDISETYIELTRNRLNSMDLFTAGGAEYEIHHADARQLLEFVKKESIDLCITSPPYWDILNQRRTADLKSVRHYGNLEGDLGVIAGYSEFLDELTVIFERVLQALKPGAYCVVVVMDLRKKDRFFPFHSDLADRMTRIGYIFDDIIIWDRGREYNNLRPLGYPSVFRVNKIHEFILIFQKPKK